MTYLEKLRRAKRLANEAAAELEEAYVLAPEHQQESVYHLAKKLQTLASDVSGNALSIFLLVDDLLTSGFTKEEK